MTMTYLANWFRATSVRKSVNRFVADTQGTLTVESVIVLPMYLTWFITTFMLFDLYRVASTNEKAAYTVADIISRQGGSRDPDGEVIVDQAFVEGLNTVYDYMLSNRGNTWVRVTSFEYDASEDEYVFDGSVGSGVDPYGEGDLDSLRPLIPIMADGDAVIVVETQNEMGYLKHLGGIEFLGSDGVLNTFIVTSPRLLNSSIPVGEL